MLVVDDEDLNIRLIEALLKPQGYEVTLARDGEEALRKVAEMPPDIILLDIMMPKMNGFEVAERLRADPNTRIIPIVMVTALQDVEDRVRALEVGADDFFNQTGRPNGTSRTGAFPVESQGLQRPYAQLPAGVGGGGAAKDRGTSAGLRQGSQGLSRDYSSSLQGRPNTRTRIPGPTSFA